MNKLTGNERVVLAFSLALIAIALIRLRPDNMFSGPKPTASVPKVDSVDSATIRDTLLSRGWPPNKFTLKIDSSILRDHDSVVVREGGGL